MIRLLVQDGITPQDYYLFLDINGPQWAHDLAQHASFERMSTYQIVEGDTTLVGYRIEQSMLDHVVYHIKMEEYKKRHMLPEATE